MSQQRFSGYRELKPRNSFSSQSRIAMRFSFKNQLTIATTPITTETVTQE